jgi:hypothetical protein
MECDLFGSAVRSDTTVILQVDGSLLFESRRLQAPELAANSFAFSKQQRVQEVIATACLRSKRHSRPHMTSNRFHMKVEFNVKSKERTIT